MWNADTLDTQNRSLTINSTVSAFPNVPTSPNVTTEPNTNQKPDYRKAMYRKLYAIPYGSIVNIDGHRYIHLATRGTTATLRHTATDREYRKPDLLIPYDTMVDVEHGPFDGWQSTVEKLGRMPQESDVIPEMRFQDLKPGDTFSLHPSEVYDRCTKLSPRTYEKREYSRRSKETATATMPVYNVLMK